VCPPGRQRSPGPHSPDSPAELPYRQGHPRQRPGHGRTGTATHERGAEAEHSRAAGIDQDLAQPPAPATGESPALISARIGTTDWHLTGIRSSKEGQRCDHCPRRLKHLYDVTNTVTGQALTVGRGCCKKITGWTLSAAQAAQLLRHAAEQARQAAVWAQFTDAYPEGARTVEQDSEQWRPAWPGQANLAAHFRWQVSRGAISRAAWAQQLAVYLRDHRPQPTA
jgi:hypothetical protein